MATIRMQENLKKYFYSGIGLAAHTADIVQKSVNEFVKQGKVNEADGKKIIGEALKKVERQRFIIETKYNETLNRLIQLSALEVSKLQKRIEHLEKKGSAQRSAPVSTKTVVKSIKKAVKSGKKVAAKAKKKVA